MNELKDRILKAIKDAKEKLDITLIYKDWGNKRQKCACPLGCVLLVNDHGLYFDSEQNTAEAAHVLGVSEDWVYNFICGFDGDTQNENESVEFLKEAWELGYSIRKEVDAIDYSNFLDRIVD